METRMKKIIIITTLYFAFGLEDEFFESKTSIGGYGEMHFDMEANEGNGKLDFHRFIIYYKHQFTPKWSMMSEIEIEHNMNLNRLPQHILLQRFQNRPSIFICASYEAKSKCAT